MICIRKLYHQREDWMFLYKDYSSIDWILVEYVKLKLKLLKKIKK